MDKSQYHPPHTVYSEELYSHIEKSAVQQTPERLHAPFQFVKDIEELVDSFRETAEAIEQKDGREVKLKYVPITFWRPARPHEEILKEQKDTERLLSIPLFRDKGRYCVHYGGKVNTPYATPDVGHWYIEEIIDGTLGTGSVTHIETHPQHIKKFNHDGQRVPVTISDLEVFAPLVYHYVHAVIEAYPFDRDRAEVILEDLEIPDDVSMLLPPEHHDPQSSYRLAA